ncbi:Retrovirus-related Pol polyprotein from transposon 17.6 [Biomphalaria glabrata]
MTPDLRIFIDESGVTTPQEIVSYSDRFLAAHREQKPKTSDQTPPVRKAGNLPNPQNTANHKNGKQTRQPPNQPYAPQLPSSRQVKKWCEFHKSSGHDTRDCRNVNRTSPQPLLLITKADSQGGTVGSSDTDSGEGLSEDGPPPTVETVLVNNRPATCANDTGCKFEAIIRRSFVNPKDFTGEFVEIQLADRRSPPQTLPVARINVESRYVHGIVNAAVMDDPCYDLTLGCRYVFLGTPKRPALPTASILNATPPEVPPSEPVIAAPVTTRAQTPDESPEEVPNTLPKEYREAQRDDPSLLRLFAIVDEGRPQTGKSIFFCKAGLLYRRPGNKDGGRSQVVVPMQFRTQVLQTGHSSSLSAHQGQGATISRISYYYFWPGMANDIRRYVASCPQCQRMSPRCHVPPVPLGKTPLIETPFKRVSVDIVGPLPRTKKRNAYILCVANGLVERFNHSLLTMLRRLVDGRPEEWDTYLNAALFAYREVPQASLGYSPYQVIFGSQPRGPLEVLKQNWTKEQVDPEIKTVSKYVQDLQERLATVRSIATDNLKRARKRQEKNYNRRAKERSIEVGKSVLVLLPKHTNKLQICWQGPFEVVEKISATNYKVKIGRKQKVFHVNLLKEFLERPSSDAPSALMSIAIAEDTVEPRNLVEYPLLQSESFKDVSVSNELTSAQAEGARVLLEKYGDVLTDKPGRTNLETFSMKLLDDKPVRVKSYPLPHAKAEIVEQEVAELLKAGIITPSTSPYNAPVVLVRKPCGAHRMCIDFRRLNAVTEFQAEPLPDPATIFANISHARFFSKFDLSRGYYQIEVSPECRPLLAFSTPQGHYEFQTVPFGISNASSVFTKMMRRLLAPIKRSGVHNFIDDILVASETWSEHLQTVESLLQRLRETGLTARPSKCLIGFTKLKFLGHMVQENQLLPDEEKINHLLNAPRPKTKTAVRSFLGMCGYYQKFLPNYNAIAAPLSDLTKKDQPDKVIWDENCETAYQELKRLLAAKPVLRLPDLSKTFVLRTDASSTGIGAVLMQEGDESPPTLFPIAYASRKLSQAEERYATVELECLALVWAIEKFQPYLYGREFVLQTDHRPLVYLSSSKNLNSRLMRWSLLLQPYSFRVEHIPGSSNFAPDFLSRHSLDLSDRLMVDQRLKVNAPSFTPMSAERAHDGELPSPGTLGIDASPDA